MGFTEMTCKAIRQGDQMCCGRCGLQWDVDDSDRPQCLMDDGTPHNPVIDGVEIMKRANALLKKDVGKEALKELHHIVEDKEP